MTIYKQITLLALALASCVGGDYQAPPARECEVNIAVAPVENVRGSRLADNGTEPQEDLITRMVIMLYQDNKLVYRPVVVDNIEGGSCTVKLPAITCDMQIITNLDPSNTAEFISKGNPLGSAMDSWGLTSDVDVGRINKDNGFRMWGVKRGVTISEGVKIADFPLHRMLARIDVQVTGDADATGDFKMKEIRLCNFLSNGYVIPRFSNWDFGANSVGGKAAAPSLPSVARTAYTAFTGRDLSPKKCLAAIYCSENAKAASATDTNAPYLLIQGDYKGTAGWYRVDFYAHGAYIDILRNHRYTINIAKITVPGLDTPEAAASAPSSSIQTDIVLWNDFDMGDTVFDGAHFLSINPSSLDLPDNSTTPSITIKTDAGLTLTSSNISCDADWLWFSMNPPRVEGDKNIHTLNLNCKDNTGNARETVIKISAGNLKQGIKVSQQKKVRPQAMFGNTYSITHGMGAGDDGSWSVSCSSSDARWLIEPSASWFTIVDNNGNDVGRTYHKGNMSGRIRFQYNNYASRNAQIRLSGDSGTDIISGKDVISIGQQGR